MGRKIKILVVAFFLMFLLVSCGEPVNYNVTFMSTDGTIFKVESVEEGGSATAPTNVERVGYTFISWSEEFDNVVSDLEVKALYE
ncbi:MAG TPA: InlB B-repeat-containing protein, partial [Acholeplasmataceae bacterium]|nr:InlB B-repeat-containing protein [Acholeplasmataceae bacterium]